MRKQIQGKAKTVGVSRISRHSQLFLHVVFIHAVVMYMCSWYVEHARTMTELRLLTSNITALQRLTENVAMSVQIS
jgi:hypothetical protein